MRGTRDPPSLEPRAEAVVNRSQDPPVPQEDIRHWSGAARRVTRADRSLRPGAADESGEPSHPPALPRFLATASRSPGVGRVRRGAMWASSGLSAVPYGRLAASLVMVLLRIAVIRIVP
jgi:hypothetical protein